MTSRFDLRQNLFRIPDNISVALGLQWAFIGEEPVDLDASCVAFDEQGQCLEAVFFNHLVSEAGYMEHSGDNTTGEDCGEDDETIFFHVQKIPSEVCYLMVCVTSYTGIDFTLVEEARCRLVNVSTKEMVGEFSLGIVGRHTATLMCAFSRVPPQINDPSSQTWWDLREINIPCQGYTFCDVLPKMLDLLAIPEDHRSTCLGSLPNYSLAKDETTENITLSQLKMGLGWDGDNDLDASLVMLDAEGNYIDHVNAKYGKLKSRDGAVTHSGDKLNGYDVAGDDEFIEVDLNKVNKDVNYIVFLALLYDGFAKTLGSVPACYCRLMNKSSPLDPSYKEISRYSCSKNAGDATAVVFSVICRAGTAHWESKTINETTEGHEWIDVFPFIHNLAPYINDDMEGWQVFKNDAIKPFAVEVFFLAAKDLAPLEPHHFCCHCEAWVCDRKGKDRVKTHSVEDRENVVWSDSGSFVVTKMDRIRVMVYEHAMVGWADLVLKDIGDTILGGTPLEAWFPLTGHHISGEVKLRIEQSSLESLTVETSSKNSWCAVM